MIICVKLNGGLGNQLFQYAAARALALKHRSFLCLDQTGFMTADRGKTPRAYDLHHFALEDKSNSRVYFRHRLTPFRAILARILLRCAARLPHQLYAEPELDFREIPTPHSQLFMLQGYFQSHHYFQAYRRQLLQELTVVDAMPAENSRFLAMIMSSRSVSLHVRRGDYINNHLAQQFHGVCPIEYYRAAINKLETRFAGPLTYFIFSDDMHWCRENFGFLADKHFVDCNEADTGFFDLHLMRHCKYHIIANSSFSWWGAWLAEYGQGTVIYPRQWFANEPVNCQSRFPAEWEPA